MLTVTLNSDATLMTVYHPELTTSATGLAFRLRIGCSGVLSSISVSGEVITNNSFQLSLIDVFPTNTPIKFADGVYYAEIQFDLPSGPDVLNKDGNTCFFIDYDLKCKLDSLNTDQMRKYKALKYSQNCDCNCEMLCQIFDSLNQTPISNDNNCGCQ